MHTHAQDVDDGVGCATHARVHEGGGEEEEVEEEGGVYLDDFLRGGLPEVGQGCV